MSHTIPRTSVTTRSTTGAGAASPAVSECPRCTPVAGRRPASAPPSSNRVASVTSTSEGVIGDVTVLPPTAAAAAAGGDPNLVALLLLPSGDAGNRIGVIGIRCGAPAVSPRLRDSPAFSPLPGGVAVALPTWIGDTAAAAAPPAPLRALRGGERGAAMRTPLRDDFSRRPLPLCPPRGVDGDASASVPATATIDSFGGVADMGGRSATASRAADSGVAGSRGAAPVSSRGTVGDTGPGDSSTSSSSTICRVLRAYGTRDRQARMARHTHNAPPRALMPVFFLVAALRWRLFRG